MSAVRSVLLAAGFAATAVLLSGCDGGNGEPKDMISMLCSDATAKCVEKTDLIHEHLEEIQEKCKTKPEPEVKPCEDDKIAGIDAAEENITSFYNKHCVEHVKEWLGNKTVNLETVHTLADKFEQDHMKEIETELHAGIHKGMESGKAGAKTTLQIVCTHEVEKEVERDGGLVHEHLKEVETGCNKTASCEEKASMEIVAAKDTTISEYITHCSDPNTWSLWAIHPAVDNFATVHKAEIKKALHEGIHEAMQKAGLESATEAFSVQSKPVAPVPSTLSKAASPQLVLAVAGLAAVLAVVGFGTARLVRPRAPPPMEDGADIEELQAALQQ